MAALLIEGPVAIGRSLVSVSPGAWLAVAWQAAGNTLFGYGLRARLLSRHPAATVTPLALLVSVFGVGAATIIPREPLPAWKLLAAGLVLAGLAVNILASRRSAREREQVLGEPV